MLIIPNKKPNMILRNLQVYNLIKQNGADKEKKSPSYLCSPDLQPRTKITY